MDKFQKLREKSLTRYRKLMGIPHMTLPEQCDYCKQRIEHWEPLSIIEREHRGPLVVHKECKGACLKH